MDEQPGPIVLIGSGETSASGRQVYDAILSRYSPPVGIAILETPAGFQPNSALVAGRVAEFLGRHLPGLRPRVTVVPARRRGTPLSPDEPSVCAPLARADAIFLGAGSPTYTVRQLAGSLAWQYVAARQWLGATAIFSSAAAIAVSAHALPIYEIYKVGDDPHWRPGLDLLGPFGLSLAVVPHWNNAEGGADLDTSRCFMGAERFQQLLALLPADAAVLGIDEHTALVLDVAKEQCLVMGRGTVTLLRGEREVRFGSRARFAMAELGRFRRPDTIGGVAAPVWQAVREAAKQDAPESTAERTIPEAVLALVRLREAARAHRDWAAADALRDEIAAQHWQVRDRPEGPELVPVRPDERAR